MKRLSYLSDHNNPIVKQCAMRLTSDAKDDRARLERLFLYVRDEIKFGYPLKGDLVSATDTIRLGYGQCNTKSTVLVALCRAVGITSRIHFSLIRKEIQRGIFTGFTYWLMPDFISHSWVEVFVDGRWRNMDSFINDREFFLAGKMMLKEKGWDTGYSIACSGGDANNEFTIDDERFLQMDAVTDDHGVWEDASEYYMSDKYRNHPGFFKLLLYALMVRSLNRRVARLRGKCSAGICGMPVRKQDAPMTNP
jgi:hypothetical protein